METVEMRKNYDYSIKSVHKALINLFLVCFLASALTSTGQEGVAGLHGRVVDAAGTPVSGARVAISPGEQTVTTAEDGRFAVAELEPGTYELTVKADGYATAQSDVIVGDSGAELELHLAPTTTALDEIVVTSSYRLYREEPVPTVTLDREQIVQLPHFGDDLYRAITVLPGTTNADFSSRFTLRGGLHEEILVQLDGLELFEPFHLKDAQGFFSIIDPQVIGGVDLLPGGFSAEHGDRLSGVLDMTTARPGEERELRLGISFTNASAGGAGTFSDGKGRWSGSLRRGYLDVVLSLTADDDDENEPDPRYWDAFGRLERDLSPSSSLAFSLLAADDSLEFEEDEPDEIADVDTTYGNAYLWLTHNHLISSTTAIESLLSWGRVDRDRGIFSIEGNELGEVFDERQLDVLSFKQQWSFQAGDRHFLKWGYEARAYDAAYDYRNTLELTDAIADVRFQPPVGQTSFVDDISSEQYAAYVADRLQLGSRLVVEIGGRYDHQTLTDDDQLSPRLNLVADLQHLGAWRFGWGHFYQSQRPHELDVQDGETVFYDAEKAEHLTAGWERELGRSYRLRIDAYRREVSAPRPRYENLFDPFTAFPEAQSDRIRIAPDSVLAEGVELFLSRRGTGRFNWWASYALSSIVDRIGGRDQPRSIDQQNAVTLSASYRPSRRWNLNAVWFYHTGWPTTAVTSASFDQDGELTVGIGPFYERNHSAYHRLDVRASRRQSVGHGELELYIDVQNLYNRENIRGFDISDDSFVPLPDGGIDFRPDREEWLGIIPSFGVSWTF